MFEWDKSAEHLDVPVERILRLHRSMGDIQVALPGLPSQKASVWVCAYAGSKGGRVVVVFHLRKSCKLALYRHSQGEVPAAQTKSLLDEGIRFAESLGFVLDAIDFQQMSPQEKLACWNDLSLFHGTVAPVPAEASAPLAETAALACPSAREIQERRQLFIRKLGHFLVTA
ncbi:MAG: hypothetical protein P8X63_11460 [Desulfuromonadaceae bacterium]